jgi:hypothetical protein
LFFPLLVFLIISSLLNYLREILKERRALNEVKYFYKKLNYKNLTFFLENFFQTIFILLIFQIIILLLESNFIFIEYFKNPFFVFVLLMIFSRFLFFKRGYYKRLFVLFSVFIFIVLVFLSGNYSYLIRVTKMSLIFVLIIRTVNNILNNYIKKHETKSIKIKKIKKGMIIDNEILLFLPKNIREKCGKINVDGITNEQLAIIKYFFRNSDNCTVKIQKTIPFAPFMFLSATISILTQSSFYVIIINAFYCFE